MRTHSSIKILLIQIRSDADLIPAEREEFVKFSGLREEQIVTLDVFRNPYFKPGIIDDFDALMIGGLSDDDSTKIKLPDSFLPFNHSLNALIFRAIDKKIPSLLSCGGFMLASMILGAEVIIDPDKEEMGVYDIYLTAPARKDGLLGTLPPVFKAVSGHIKSTINLPESCIHMAFSDRCPIHGFKITNAPFYAFQFHPEITCPDLQSRVEAYKQKYFKSEEGYRNFINLSESTAIANSIIGKFVTNVVQ